VPELRPLRRRRALHHQDDMQSVHDEIRSSDRILSLRRSSFRRKRADQDHDRPNQTFWAEKYVHKTHSPEAFGARAAMLVGGMKRNEKNVGFECSEATVRAFFGP
jgi:hypothetical protein